MAFQLTVPYNQPDDVDAFDRHYDETHAPLATKMPGVRSLIVSRPGSDADGNRPLYHLVAVVTWDSAEAFQAAMESAEGQATVADLANFAGAGVQMLTGPSRAVV